MNNDMVVTIKADKTLLREIDELCTTPSFPSRAAFMRDALSSYLNYYNSVLLPAITQQKTVSEFYQEGGAVKYSND
ncbi:ribbon-helix-helix domain-containing protein [Gammaproteobacteria bacterium]|jgi:metal-responsive CopG/Arc/MetJ family transcriptional regulator|nr:ribbon-helix-helix domain-containing protein [Gammaproteobacteria bacterium]